MTLDSLRKSIDGLDEQLVSLLNERTRLALEIGKLKRKSQAEVYVPARERAVLERVCQLNQGPLSPESLQAIYREIMSASLALEHDIRVAYLGPPATFTHQAARSRFGASVEYVHCDTITDVFTAVENRTADYGVVPIENSIDGAVTHTLDQFIATPARICAEVFLPISHHLLSKGSREAVRRIYSKAEVFGQCRGWLQQHCPGVELIPANSTARAAEIAAREEGAAAIASALAGELYGLSTLAENIQDLVGNTTRFLVIAKTYGPPSGKDKTSLAIAVRHRAGALHEALGVFTECGINMTKIESRPSKAKAWEYFFFVDIEGHAEEPKVKQALEKLSAHCMSLTVLGAYPQAMAVGAPPVAG